MKKAFSAKNIFLKIFCICAAALFPACDIFQETPKDFLEDYASIATVAKYEFSREPISQGAWLNVVPSDDDDLTITYFVDNPGNHRLRAVIEFPNGSALSGLDFSFPENDSLLQTWTEETTDDDGNPARVTRTESETNFLKSTFSIKIPKDTLADIDGKTALFDISPTVTLYRADFGKDSRMQSSHTIPLRCNTPPAPIEDAMGEKIVEGGKETLVLAIKLPALKGDDKYLKVEENGRTHVFEKAVGTTDFNSATSTDGLWTISATAPDGIEAATFNEDGSLIAPTDKGWIPNCYITTDINIKGRAPFGITLTLSDEGGLSSSRTFTSHGQKCSPPISSSTSPLAQSEDDGMATYILNAESGATIHYTVTTAGGAKVSEGSGASPLSIKLPAGTFNITAYAEKEGFARSDAFTNNNTPITVTPSVFFVSANGSDMGGNGSKSNPFATIAHAADSLKSLTPPPANAKIFLLTDLEISDNQTITLPPAAGTTLNLRGCKGGNAGNRVTVSFKFSQANISSAFAIEGTVQMQDLTIRQTQDSSAINGDGIVIRPGNTLSLKNVSITEMKTGIGAVNLEGSLNILGGVNITGNKDASGNALNLYLPANKTIAIQSGSLTGTQIGVSTAGDPANAPVPITSGYSLAGYSSSQLNSYFTSDKGFALKMDGGEAALTASGGSIGIVPPTKITFSLNEYSGNGNNITISAFGDGTLLDFAAFTTLTADIYLVSVSTGKHIDLKSNNPFSFDPSWNFDSGDYVIKIYAHYGGTKFSGELTYKYTKPQP